MACVNLSLEKHQSAQSGSCVTEIYDERRETLVCSTCLWCGITLAGLPALSPS